MYQKHQIVIAGAGGIGRAVGLILAEQKDFSCAVFIGDVNPAAAEDAVNWIKEGLTHEEEVSAFIMPKEGSSPEMDKVFDRGAIILDCLPGSQAPRMARMARKHQMHYANLTEYVKETNEVIVIAEGAEQGFVLQTGLAPGFINVLANQLYKKFCRDYGVEKVERIKMKVGALTQHAEAPHFYGFTWSPVGVATEYLKDAVVVRDYKTREVPALSECETLVIDGVTYEDNLTSGGAADLPDALQGKVKDLDYKTLRYPGHYRWVADIVAAIPEAEDTVQKLQDIMQSSIPSVEDDVVIVYASVQGFDAQGVLRALQAAYRIEPMMVGHKKLRAIQTTTASPLAESARMLLSNKWSGVVFQSMIDPEEFMNGVFVTDVYGKPASEAQAEMA